MSERALRQVVVEHLQSGAVDDNRRRLAYVLSCPTVASAGTVQYLAVPAGRIRPRMHQTTVLLIVVERLERAAVDDAHGIETCVAVGAQDRVRIPIQILEVPGNVGSGRRGGGERRSCIADFVIRRMHYTRNRVVRAS